MTYSIDTERLTGGGRAVVTVRRAVERARTLEGAATAGDFEALRVARRGKAVDIVVPVHDDPSSARDCLEAVLERTTGKFAWRLTVVDNACSAYARGMLEEMRVEHRFKLLRMKKYGGHLPAMYAAVEQTRGDWIVFLDQRVVPVEGWLEGMMLAAASDPEVAMVSPWTTGDVPPPAGMNHLSAGARVRASTRAKPVPGLPDEMCFAVRRDALRNAGGLDVARYAPGYGEGADLFMRLTKAGKRAVRSGYVLRDTASGGGFWRAGRERFLARWGDAAVEARAAIIKHGGAEDAAARMLAAKASPRPAVAFVFRDFELCGATLAATHICNRLADWGWDAFIAYTREAPGHSVRKLPARFTPLQGGTPQQLVKILRARLRGAALVAPTWRNAADVMEACGGREDLVPLYYVQDDERRFRRTNGKLAANPRKIEDAIGSVPNRVANSRWVQKMVRELGHGCGRIPIGVDSFMFYPGDKSGPLRVMAHCRPSTPRRGWPFIRDVVNMAAKHVDFEFVAYDQPYKAAELAVERHGNLGQVTPRELAIAMRTVHVFIEGSEYQGFGMQALEAMSCGCALVSTDNGGVREYGRDGENCAIVKRGNPKAAADRVVALLNNETVRAKRGALARSTAEGFDWRIVARKWNDYLRKLMRGAP